MARQNLFADITCQDIESQVDKWCDLLPGYFDPQFDGMIVTEACCACGGGIIYEPSFVQPLSSYSILTSSECIDEPEWFYATEQDDIVDADELKVPVCLCLVYGGDTTSAILLVEQDLTVLFFNYTDSD